MATNAVRPRISRVANEAMLPKIDRVILSGIATALHQSLGPFRGVVIATIFLSILHGLSSIIGLTAFVPVVSILAGQGVEQLAEIPHVGDFVLSLSHDRDVIFYSMLAVIVLLSLFKAGLQLSITLVEASTKTRVDSLWQRRILTSWLNAPYHLHGMESAGRIMHLSSREVVQMSQSAKAFVQLVSSSLQGAIGLVFLATVAPVAFLGVCAAVALIMLPLAHILRLAYRASKDNTTEAGNYINRTHEVVKRIELIDVFGTAKRETEGIFHFYDLYLKSYLRLYFANGLSPCAVQISLSLMLSGVMIFFFHQGLGPENLATVIMFLGGLVLVQPQVDRFSQAASMLARIGTAYDAIRPVIELPARPPDPQASAVHQDFSDIAVTVEHLNFSYPPRDNAPARILLDDISFNLQPGRLYMLFGPTGAGKTTLLRLMQKLLTPDSGEIRYGGAELARIPQSMIAGTVLMMDQERPTFTGTVRDNIAYGLHDVDDTQIDDAVALAGVDEFLPRLSDGLDTHIGNDGALLSGGQRQRVSFARVITSAPQVMLLDEPTSALDRDMEHRIIGTLFKLRNRGHTIVMSTHKVELAPFADGVLWFDAGKIRVGTFEHFHHSLQQLIPHDDMRKVLNLRAGSD